MAPRQRLQLVALVTLQLATRTTSRAKSMIRIWHSLISREDYHSIGSTTDDSRDSHEQPDAENSDSDQSGQTDGLDDFGELDTASEGESNYGSEDDEFAPFRWLEQMDGVATLKGPPKREQIGYCNSKLIRRHAIRATFYDDIEEPSVETSRLGFDLFDRYGRLRREFKTHPTKRGSGLWKHELDDGDLLLFEYVRIDEPHRRLGLGRRLVRAVLEMTRKRPSHSSPSSSRAFSRAKSKKKSRTACRMKKGLSFIVDNSTQRQTSSDPWAFGG
jgi:GNAT superfamily N-acetyltransferase